MNEAGKSLRNLRIPANRQEYRGQMVKVLGLDYLNPSKDWWLVQADDGAVWAMTRRQIESLMGDKP
jgi:hypothetical protein